MQKPASNPAYQHVIIEKIKEETAGVKTFILRSDSVLPYKADQFLTFVFDDIYGEERRSYSFSSSPGVDKNLSVTLKRITNGKYSRPLIDHAKEGDKLIISGVAGQFVLPENITAYKQIFFLAAGIGITPVYSLIKTLLHCYTAIEVVLVYSNSSPKHAVFYDELLQLHQQFPKRFRLEFLFSSSPDLTKARLSKWLLPQLLKVYDIGSKGQQLFYTCGPFAYMRMVIITLEEAGYDQAQIKKEIFDTTRPAARREPPDKAARKVFINLKGARYELIVQYPQTILQAAKMQHINIPYSCEAGRCSSCVMQCVSGKVWMSYNEVLTEKEIQQGKVLTCVGYPMEGDVHLAL